MEKSQIKDWLRIGLDGDWLMRTWCDFYPVTIVSQRYGCWPGNYLAFPPDVSDTEFSDLNGGDMEAIRFREEWDEDDTPVGFGASPQGALDDLVHKMYAKYRAILEQERCRYCEVHCPDSEQRKHPQDCMCLSFQCEVRKEYEEKHKEG